MPAKIAPQTTSMSKLWLQTMLSPSMRFNLAPGTAEKCSIPAISSAKQMKSVSIAASAAVPSESLGSTRFAISATPKCPIPMAASFPDIRSRPDIRYRGGTILPAKFRPGASFGGREERVRGHIYRQ